MKTGEEQTYSLSGHVSVTEHSILLEGISPTLDGPGRYELEAYVTYQAQFKQAADVGMPHVTGSFVLYYSLPYNAGKTLFQPITPVVGPASNGFWIEALGQTITSTQVSQPSKTFEFRGVYDLVEEGKEILSFYGKVENPTNAGHITVVIQKAELKVRRVK